MFFPEIITLNDSLVITVFSMLLVFATLIVLSYTIDGFRVLANKAEKKNRGELGPVKAISEVNNPISERIEEKTMEQEDDTELIAVITASIAAMLSKPINNIVVRNIVRVPQNTPIWGTVSRQEMSNK